MPGAPTNLYGLPTGGNNDALLSAVMGLLLQQQGFENSKELQQTGFQNAKELSRFSAEQDLASQKALGDHMEALKLKYEKDVRKLDLQDKVRERLLGLVVGEAGYVTRDIDRAATEYESMLTHEVAAQSLLARSTQTAIRANMTNAEMVRMYQAIAQSYRQTLQEFNTLAGADVTKPIAVSVLNSFGALVKGGFAPENPTQLQELLLKSVDASSAPEGTKSFMKAMMSSKPEDFAAGKGNSTQWAAALSKIGTDASPLTVAQAIESVEQIGEMLTVFSVDPNSGKVVGDSNVDTSALQVFSDQMPMLKSLGASLRGSTSRWKTVPGVSKYYEAGESLKLFQDVLTPKAEGELYDRNLVRQATQTMGRLAVNNDPQEAYKVGGVDLVQKMWSGALSPKSQLALSLAGVPDPETPVEALVRQVASERLMDPSTTPEVRAAIERFVNGGQPDPATAAVEKELYARGDQANDILFKNIGEQRAYYAGVRNDVAEVMATAIPALAGNDPKAAHDALSRLREIGAGMRQPHLLMQKFKGDMQAASQARNAKNPELAKPSRELVDMAMQKPQSAAAPSAPPTAPQAPQAPAPSRNPWDFTQPDMNGPVSEADLRGIGTPMKNAFTPQTSDGMPPLPPGFMGGLGGAAGELAGGVGKTAGTAYDWLQNMALQTTQGVTRPMVDAMVGFQTGRNTGSQK